MFLSEPDGKNCYGAPLHIGPACRVDLPEINALIERAVMAWPMAQRVKRRSVPVLQYDHVDADTYELSVCQMGGSLVGVTAIDVDLAGNNAEPFGVLIHGIYVDPATQHRGIGKTLLTAAEQRGRGLGREGMLVKAERVSRGFFERCGYIHVVPKNDADYPYLYWKSLCTGRPTPAHTSSFTDRTIAVARA